MKPPFTPGGRGEGGGVTRGIVGVSEGLGLFIVGFDVKARFCFLLFGISLRLCKPLCKGK